ncbi:hypothetical protein GJAV_G00107540 [Gymnothorax javanicus]|nr:hypothetical protein GJAV_G00107540 [Gymnothorax javanicus]
MNVEGVCEARILKTRRLGMEQESLSVLLEFKSELPERVFLDYVSYRVREYVRAPLRCCWFQENGHVAAGCRRRTHRCRRCGKEGCMEDECTIKEQIVCFHCEVGALDCKRRKKEQEVERKRTHGRMSYAVAVKRVQVEKEKVGKEQARVQEIGKPDENLIRMERRHFLAFIAMVVICSRDLESKMERIKMVVDAAREFFGIMDVRGDEIQRILERGFGGGQMTEK